MPKRKQEPRSKAGDTRTGKTQRAGKQPKTRNVFVRMPKAKVTAIRRAGLDGVNDRKRKGGLVVRVPVEAKRVTVKVTKEELEVRYTAGGKRFRRVDTALKPGDWTRTDSPEFLRKGRKKKERLYRLKIAVRGYDSKRYHSPETFGRYIDERLLPSIRKQRGKKHAAKKKLRNFLTVRRIYVSTHRRSKTKTKRTRKR